MDSTPPANGSPVTPAAPDPNSIGGWFRQNGFQLVVIAAVVGVVLRYLHPLDLLLAGLGLSFIIFLHELGHFLTAKWCDVHVKTFSIGFGPALPFCSFKYGETTYKLALIPLGGFVAMVGEGDEHGDTVEPDDETEEEAKQDPRSFKNKTVWQRMLIISAGVIMNVVLGAVCFVATYLHGVQESPAVASHVEPGSAAWRAGFHSGTEITEINGRKNPWFNDLKPTVSSVSKGETVDLTVSYRGQAERKAVEPLRQEGALHPVLGIGPPVSLTLPAMRRDDAPPYRPGSAAEKAGADGQPGFRPGDTVVGMTDPDPARNGAVTNLAANWNDLPGPWFDYNRRLMMLAGRKKPVAIQVVRKDQPAATPDVVTVPPAYRWDTGLRMRMGPVTAVRQGSPAEKAGVVAGRPAAGKAEAVTGDEIKEVEVTAGGTKTRFTTDAAEVEKATDKTAVRLLDPLRLSHDLNELLDPVTIGPDGKPTGAKVAVAVTVLREKEHTPQPVKLDLDWDPTYRFESAMVTQPSTPVPVNGLGLAYQVSAVVNAVAPGSAAEKAGVKAGDKVAEVRFKTAVPAGEVKTSKWQELKDNQWAFVDNAVQTTAPHEIDAKVVSGGQTAEKTLTAAEDQTWPVSDPGLDLTLSTQLQKADGVLDALEMGAYRTVRSIKMVYLGLYALVGGQMSVMSMSGPLTLGRFAYLIAGEDVWHLLLFMGLISINLAVVNFLPIPVLDGGHMVFLLYELVRGKPAPERVQAALTYLGLAAILSLMVFVIGLDIWRMI